MQRRNSLIQSARHFLTEREPQEISFKEIAKHAGVPEGSAYYFFANKYDLFSALAAELGQSFVTEVASLFGEKNADSWQQFFAQVIKSSAKIYRADPVARKVLLGRTMPNEVKYVDKGSIEDYVVALEIRFHELFEAPPIPKFRTRLLYALTMVDAIFELDQSDHDDLTDEIVDEASKMMVSYLANYIPSDLDLKNPS